MAQPVSRQHGRRNFNTRTRKKQPLNHLKNHSPTTPKRGAETAFLKSPSTWGFQSLKTGVSQTYPIGVSHTCHRGVTHTCFEAVEASRKKMGKWATGNCGIRLEASGQKQRQGKGQKESDETEVSESSLIQLFVNTFFLSLRRNSSAVLH